MTIRAGVLGATGYTGAELLRLLSGHPEVDVSWVTSEKFAGMSIGEVFPGLRGIMNLKCHSISKLAELPKVDVVFSCLPEGTSSRFVSKMLDEGARVIDFSADFRLGAAGAEKYESIYGKKHPMPALLEEAVYGLPEMGRDAIKGARLVSNPGCYATSVILGLAPLVSEGLLGGGERIFVDAKAGVSGAGRAPRLETHYIEVSGSVSADFEVGRRQVVEMEEKLAELSPNPVDITFVSHRIPVNRGIYTTIYAALKPEKGEADLHRAFSAYYKGETFIRILPDGGIPDLKNTTYSNYADIGAFVQDGSCVVCIALDNLGKGASGQAVQNMNAMFALPEWTGLKEGVMFP